MTTFHHETLDRLGLLIMFLVYLSSATSNLAHLDVGLDQLVASFVTQLRVERLLRVRLKLTKTNLKKWHTDMCPR